MQRRLAQGEEALQAEKTRLTRGRARLLAVTVLFALLGSAGSAAAAETPPAESLEQNGLTLYTTVLGELDQLDRRAQFLEESSRQALLGMWAEHRLQAAIDPYSLALHQEGRLRFDPFVKSMREATLAADFQGRRGVEFDGEIYNAKRTYEKARSRLVDELGALRALVRDPRQNGGGTLAAADHSAIRRRAMAAHDALARMVAYPVRARKLVSDHRDLWLGNLASIEKAVPTNEALSEMAPATRAALDEMRKSVAVMERENSATVATAQKAANDLFTTLDAMRQKLASLAESATPAK